MKQLVLIFFIVITSCGIICAEDTGDKTAAVQTSVSSAHGKKGLFSRQRNGLSLTAFKETINGADEVFERDSRNIALLMEKCGDLGNDKLLLLFISTVFCCAVMVFGLKKLKHPGKESEHPGQQ